MGRDEPIPPNAVQAGTTPGDGVCYVGRFNKEAGKINTEGGKMWNFWSCDTVKEAQQEAEILVQFRDQASVFWAQIKQGESIPNGAVLAGTTTSDGEVYVGRAGKDTKDGTQAGEPGKISLKDMKMHKYLSHKITQEYADVLVCPAGVICEWIKIKRDEPIPPNA